MQLNTYMYGLVLWLIIRNYYKNKEEICENWQLGKAFAPSMEAEERGKLLKGWERAVRCTLAYSEGE